MIHSQETNRRKYERVRCPTCGSLSRILYQWNNCQYRTCPNGHEFSYDPEIEKIRSNK